MYGSEFMVARTETEKRANHGFEAYIALSWCTYKWCHILNWGQEDCAR